MNRTTKYTKELLEPIIKESKAWSEVCRKLGVTSSTGAQTYIMKVGKKYNLSTSHFKGRGWNKGRKFPKFQVKAENYLFKESKITSHRLKIILIRDGLKLNMCEICKRSQWNGVELPLELDHINSDHSDNSLSNLQILCPNCHAVETRRRIKDKKAAMLELVDNTGLDSVANKVA